MTPGPVSEQQLEQELERLLGPGAAKEFDSFSVQAALDNDLPSSSETRRAVVEGEMLSRDARQRLEAAAEVLRSLEARDPRRKTEVKERYRRHLEADKQTIAAELNKKPARTIRQFRVNHVWYHTGTRYTYFWASINYIQLGMTNGRNWIVLLEHPTEEEEHRYELMRRSGYAVAWQRPDPLSLFLMRLDWATSRVSAELPRPEVSRLERTLGVIRTVSELVLLITGVGEAIMLARLLALTTASALRAVGARLATSAALRRATAEAALRANAAMLRATAEAAARADVLGRRAATASARGTGNAGGRSARSLGANERGIPPVPTSRGARGLTEPSGPSPMVTRGAPTAGPSAAAPTPWAKLEAAVEVPVARQSVGGFQSRSVREGDRGVIVVEGRVGEQIAQSESLAQYTPKLAGEHGSHAVGLKFGENLPEAIVSGPGRTLNQGPLRRVENLIGNVHERALRVGADVETRTLLRVEYRIVGKEEVPVLLSVDRQAWVRVPGSDRTLKFVDFAAEVHPTTRAVTVTRNETLRPRSR